MNPPKARAWFAAGALLLAMVAPLASPAARAQDDHHHADNVGRGSYRDDGGRNGYNDNYGNGYNNNYYGGMHDHVRGGGYDQRYRQDDQEHHHHDDGGGIGPGYGALIGGGGGAALGAIFGGGMKGTLIGGAAGAGLGALGGKLAQGNNHDHDHHGNDRDDRYRDHH